MRVNSTLQLHTSASRALTHLLGVVILLLLFAGCGQGSSSSPVQQESQTLIGLPVSAKASENIETVDSLASAIGSFTVDETTGELSGSASIVGMTATVAHIHRGFAGSNGPILVAMDLDASELSVPGGTILSNDQVATMKEGGYYLNVHSATFPAGELRGQLAPAGIDVLMIELSGDQADPPNISQATGTAYVTLNNSSGAVTITARSSGLIEPFAGHMHVGFAGNTGPVLIGLTQSADPNVFVSSPDSVLDEDTLRVVQSGGTYLNIHTPSVPAGEIRGQVVTRGISGIKVIRADLAASQTVPSQPSAGSAIGYLTVDANNNTLTGVVRIDGIDDATAVNVHQAGVGQIGPLLASLDQSETDAKVWRIDASPVSAAAIIQALAGNLYFNVPTVGFESGAIRGQILP